MVSLADLNNGTPTAKPWLNPVVNSIESDKVYQVSQVQNLTSSPVTLTPAQFINSVVFLNNGSTGNTVNTPSADDFKSYFSGTPQDGFSFVTYVYKTAVAIGTINLGAGVTEYRLGAGVISMPSSGANTLHYDLRYVCEGGEWTVYY
ncbi:MAG TPA: hypothetical protein VGF75_06795 [Candidatus Saccharimonadales bacterium]